MKTSYVRHYTAFLFFSVLFLTGCAFDKVDDGISIVEDEQETTFSYNVSGMALGLTRAGTLDDTREAAVETVDVLVYEVAANGQERLSYRQRATLSTVGDYSGTFKVKLARSGNNEKYTMDFIFNARAVVDKAFADGAISLDDLRAKVQKSLSVAQPHWPVTSLSYLPMSASIDEPTVISRNTIFDALVPIRSVAKIDIGLDMDGEGDLPNFTLQTVYYTHNAASAGLLVPDKNNIDNQTVKNPTLPVPYTQTTSEEYVDCTDGKSIINGIYLFELDANRKGSNGQYGVILKGNYTDAIDSKDYYYRLEFFDPGDASKRIDFLRNHHYRINILSVDGPGYGTLAEAKAGTPGNVVYELSVDEGGDINHVVYSDTYMLGVSRLALSYEGNADTYQDLKVRTNYGPGWVMTVKDENGSPIDDWIKFASDRGPANVKATAEFTLESYINQDNPRVAIATFEAGTLSLDVKITQYGRFYVTTNYTGTLMNGEGDEWEVYVWGQVPAPHDMRIRAWGVSDDHKMEVSRDMQYVSPGSYTEAARETRNLEILGNAWLPMAVRQVELQYSIDGGATWHLIKDGPQGKGHYRLKSTGRIVALYNMKDSNDQPLYTSWAQAMGLDYETDVSGMIGPDYRSIHGYGYNSYCFGYSYGHKTYPWSPDDHSSYTVYHNYDDLSLRTNNGSALWNNNEAQGIPGTGYPLNANAIKSYYPSGITERDGKTGCAVYNEDEYGFENKYPKGRWRLPSIRELEEMAQYEEHIGDLPLKGPTDYYWSSTEFGRQMMRMQALYLHFTDGAGTGDPNNKVDPIGAKSGLGNSRTRLVRCVFVPDDWVAPNSIEVAPEYFN